MKKVGTIGIGLVLLAGVQQTVYYTIPTYQIGGRELKGNMTGYELDQLKIFMKTAITKGNPLSINQVFALEDIINYNCPNGFSVGEVRGGITNQQLVNLIDSKCK